MVYSCPEERDIVDFSSTTKTIQRKCDNKNVCEFIASGILLGSRPECPGIFMILHRFFSSSKFLKEYSLPTNNKNPQL